MNYYVTGLPSWMTNSHTPVNELKNRQITVLKRLPMDEKSFGCMLSHIRAVVESFNAAIPVFLFEIATSLSQF
jgi:hypothetical protein